MIFSSPAKINLSLKIIRKRSDGFHDIDSDFQFLNWGDKIEISSSNKLSVSTTKFEVSQQENLVTQALKKIESFCDTELNYSIKIADFFFMNSAKLLKDRILNESPVKNINILEISKNKFRVILGPYLDLKSLQKDYSNIYNLNFENLEIIKND